jgi:hypothetical protein
MVDVLQNPTLGRAGYRHEVEHGQVLNHLAEPDTTRMGADRHPELGGQQQNRDVLVDAAHTCRIDLDDVHSVCLEQLLEDDPIGDVLTRGHLDGGHLTADPGVPEDVVWRRRLLDPVRIPRRKPFHPLHRRADVPPLVGVDRDPDVAAHSFAGKSHPAYVFLDVGADLELDLSETVCDRLCCELLQHLV